MRQKKPAITANVTRGDDSTDLRKQAEAELRESEEKYRLIAENMDDVIAILDMNLRFTYISPSITRLRGYTVEEAMQHPIENVLTPESLRLAYQVFAEEMQEEAKGTIPPGRVRKLELEEHRKDGSTLCVDINISFLRDKDGKATGVFTVARDITDRKRMEKSLQESEEKYRNLFENATEAIFVIQDYNVVFHNPRTMMITGYSGEEIVQRPFIDFLHPDERNIIVDRYMRLMKGEDVSQTYPFRLIQKDGGFLWFEGSAVIIEWKGKPATLNFLTDITERKLAEEVLQESEANFHRSLDESPLGIRIGTAEGETLYANRVILDIYGYDSIEELKATPVDKRYTKESFAEYQIRKEKRERGDYSPSEYEISIIRKDREVRHLQVFRKETLWNGARQHQIIYQDITDRKFAEEALQKSEERYRELSIVDDLTSLYNSRHFYVQLNNETARSNRYGQPLTLLLLDLDNFKIFNDTYGHVEGNQVLSRLGQVIKRCLRHTDSAYRYGGEEFTVILPMTTGKVAAITAERIRTEFKKEPFSLLPGQDVHLTMSIGLGQYNPQEDIKAFVHRVDQLMYQAKKNGKDRVFSET